MKMEQTIKIDFITLKLYEKKSAAHKYRQLFSFYLTFFAATYTVIAYNEFILFVSWNKQKKATRLCSLKMSDKL